MLERRVLVMTLVCDRQRTMQGLFKALRKKSAFASSMAPTIMIVLARSGNNNLCHI
ncbi:hypothetical protein [Bradyrhizobium diazoefficiens]|uniref:hypothetical protein n=1 Tax=Bradyrhizobium diazoefficiens TaxID=1355477 RepID=UPI003478303C